MMRAAAPLVAAVAAAALGCLIAPDARGAEATVTVHVRNGTTGAAAPEGLPVDIIVMVADHDVARFAGVTGADGTAAITMPIAPAPEQTIVGVASARYGRFLFRGEPFHLTGDPGAEPAVEVVVTVYDVPAAGLPRWSYIALAAIFLAAFALTALRRSDRQLAD